ncbi:MAG: IS256 family transposase [Oligoflexia bacterium]|nr:IS256 family transposase [Oligoflexia bacterium]
MKTLSTQMGFLKLEINLSEAHKALTELKENRLTIFKKLSQEVKHSVENTLNQLLRMEMELFLGTPEQNKNKRNGYKEREYAIKGIGAIRIRMPQDRQGEFKSALIPKNEQVDPRLKEDLAVLHLAGLSTRTLSMITKRVLGVELSTATISSSLSLVEDSAIEWLTRSLEGKKYWALYVDGTNFKIQRRDSTEAEPSLVVLGIDTNGFRSILAIEPGHKDNAETWRGVFKSLKERGLDFFSVKVGIMDGLPGLEKVFKEEFPYASTQRCWFHSMGNAITKVPARLRVAFKEYLSKVMYAPSEEEARSAFKTLKNVMGKDALRSVKCVEKDLDSLLAYYKFDKKYWRTLRTTNPVERINREFKRRTRAMDTLGGKTLELILAFTALKMEYRWSRHAVGSDQLEFGRE